MGKAMSASLHKGFEGLAKTLSDAQAEQNKAERTRQNHLTAAISESLNEELPTLVQQAVAGQLASTVPEAIKGQIPPALKPMGEQLARR